MELDVSGCYDIDSSGSWLTQRNVSKHAERYRTGALLSRVRDALILPEKKNATRKVNSTGHEETARVLITMLILLIITYGHSHTPYTISRRTH